MKVRFFDIEWDTYDEEEDTTFTAEECGLPKEYIIEVDEDVDIGEEGADILSDQFGYCVHRFRFEKT